MRVIYQIPNDDPRKSQTSAKASEGAGLGGIVALENAHSPIPTLTAAAMATKRVQLGTDLMIASPRSPTVTTPAAWDLNKLSNRHFYLGLGSQVKGHNERRYGIPQPLPAPRMRNYIGLVRAVWHA